MRSSNIPATFAGKCLPLPISDTQNRLRPDAAPDARENRSTISPIRFPPFNFVLREVQLSPRLVKTPLGAQPSHVKTQTVRAHSFHVTPRCRVTQARSVAANEDEVVVVQHADVGHTRQVLRDALEGREGER